MDICNGWCGIKTYDLNPHFYKKMSNFLNGCFLLSKAGEVKSQLSIECSTTLFWPFPVQELSEDSVKDNIRLYLCCTLFNWCERCRNALGSCSELWMCINWHFLQLCTPTLLNTVCCFQLTTLQHWTLEEKFTTVHQRCYATVCSELWIMKYNFLSLLEELKFHVLGECDRQAEDW